jgi:hypothetical protein
MTQNEGISEEGAEGDIWAQMGGSNGGIENVQ